MAERIEYRDHLIATFRHATTGDDFTIVRAPGRNGKFKMHASWRCRGEHLDKAREWINEQLDGKK